MPGRLIPAASWLHTFGGNICKKLAAFITALSRTACDLETVFQPDTAKSRHIIGLVDRKLRSVLGHMRQERQKRRHLFIR